MLHLLNLFCIIQRMSTGGAAAAYTSTTYPSSGSSTEFPRVTPNHAPRIPTKWCEMPWHSGKTNSDSMQLSCILMSFFPQVWLTTISAATRTTPTTSTKLQQYGALRPIPALSGKPAHLWVWLLQLLSAFGCGRLSDSDSSCRLTALQKNIKKTEVPASSTHQTHRGVHRWICHHQQRCQNSAGNLRLCSLGFGRYLLSTGVLSPRQDIFANFVSWCLTTHRKLLVGEIGCNIFFAGFGSPLQSTRWRQYLWKTPPGKLDCTRSFQLTIHSHFIVLKLQMARILIVPAIQAGIGILWILLWALSVSFLVSQVPDGYTSKAGGM